MRTRTWVAGALVAAAVIAGSALADPKPTAVDIKPYRDKLVVLTDAKGGVYVARRDKDDSNNNVLFYGTDKNKILYKQVILGGGANENEWSLDTWTPRLKEMHHGSLIHKQDGTWQKYCWGEDDAGLTELTGDKAKAVLDKYQFMTTSMIRAPHLLARDDSGVYYYVDNVRSEYGGKGYRVFVGKKGAMKQMPLTDVASDSAGEVFSTKNGDLRLITRDNAPAPVWVKGDKRTELVQLDLDVNSPLIFKDLGVYEFLGTMCDNV